MYDMLKVHVHRVQRQFRRARFHGEILQREMSLRTRRMRIEHIKKALKKHGLCGRLPCVELRAVMPHGDTALASLLLMHAEIAFTESRCKGVEGWLDRSCGPTREDSVRINRPLSFLVFPA
jgi:hypothetical protein